MNSLGVFEIVASPGASLIAGTLGVGWLIAKGKHKAGGSLNGHLLASGFILATFGYLSMIMSLGFMFFSIPLSQIIERSIGDQRFFWLLFGLGFDSVFRFWELTTIDPRDQREPDDH